MAIREFPLNAGFGFANYLLHVDGKAWGVIVAKKQGATLTGEEFIVRHLTSNKQIRPCVTQVALAETNLTLYPPGTLLVAMYGEGKTRGKCAELRISATTNQALAALQVDVQIRGYPRLFFEHSHEEMRRVASGGVQPNLNLELVRTSRD